MWLLWLLVTCTAAAPLPYAHIAGLYPPLNLDSLSSHGRFEHEIRHDDVFGGRTEARVAVAYRAERLWNADRDSVRVRLAHADSLVLEVMMFAFGFFVVGFVWGVCACGEWLVLV